jgi:hypothetical protein
MVHPPNTKDFNNVSFLINQTPKEQSKHLPACLA